MVRWVVLGAVVVAAGLGISYWQAKSSFVDGVRSVERRIREIGVDRAGKAPSEEDVAGRVERWANEAKLRITDVEVQKEGGLQSASKGMETALSTLKGPGAADGLAALRAPGHSYRVRAKVTAKRFLWSSSHTLDVTLRILGDLSHPGPAPKLRGPIDAE